MPDKHAEWIKAVLARKPHLNQAGLARALNRHRSAVTQMLNGAREIKARELLVIEQYLGEKMVADAPLSRAPAGFVAVVGEISNAWYEPGEAPRVARTLAPSLDFPDVRQVAYLVRVDVPDLDLRTGDVLIATPVDRAHQPQPGQQVVLKRNRSGLESLSITTMPAAGDVKEGEPVAISLEIRRRRQ